MPKGPSIRPTLDQVRQALFNLLGERVREARVLDLFSGTGALGMEALSRGAAEVTFVDRSSFCTAAIGGNLAGLSSGLEGDARRVRILRAGAVQAVKRMAREGRLFDLVFLDPPYGRGEVRISLNALARYAIVRLSGLVVAEQDKRDPLPALVEGPSCRLVLGRHSRYGDTVLAFYERQ